MCKYVCEGSVQGTIVNWVWSFSHHVCVHVCDSFTFRMSVCTVYTVHQGRARRLVRIFGGDFHIAWGHVGTVPTPGAVGAR